MKVWLLFIFFLNEIRTLSFHEDIFSFFEVQKKETGGKGILGFLPLKRNEN